MKLSSVFASLLAAQGALAIKRASLANVNEGQILDLLKTNENILPPNGMLPVLHLPS